MSANAGNLLWNRARVPVVDGPATDFDTGLKIVNQNWDANSANEPPLGVVVAPPGPTAGTTPASRVMVIPLPPLAAWSGITHGEPYVDPTTGTVHVQFLSATTTEVNCLFWDPHSILGPGLADTYNEVP
ncbi:MAG: hypothetical protein ACREJC_07365 [Tepidisphaeraceae bacterium]